MTEGLGGLSLREFRFVEFLIADPEANASAACAAAGYSATSPGSLAVQGSTLLSRPKVQHAIAERTRIAAEHARITPELVLAGLLANAEQAYKDSAYGASTAAWRELGRYLKLFTDRLDVTGLEDQAQRVATELGIDKAELLAMTKQLLEPPKE